MNDSNLTCSYCGGVGFIIKDVNAWECEQIVVNPARRLKKVTEEQKKALENTPMQPLAIVCPKCGRK